jgi:DNA uptake protein ComE-like DNA-binding protein
VIDELISNLVPLMAAEELVLCPRLAHALGDPLKEDHRKVRGLVEQLSMLSEGFARRSRRTSKVKQRLLTALKQVTIALDVLGTHQQAAVCHLSETLSLDEQARFAATLGAAALDAREHTVLIMQPAIPPGAAHVLRNRPDLNTAHAMSLANIERRLHRGAASEGETNHVLGPPSR